MLFADGFCVTYEHFVYIVFLVQKAQEFQCTYVLHRCIAITTALGKLHNTLVTMLCSNAFLRFVMTQARVNFGL